MKFPLFKTLSFALLALTALGYGSAFATAVGDAKYSMPKRERVQPPAALPARTEVLTVDWVDTKNAKIAIGGITYALMGKSPTIFLSGGEKVSDIGYLKSGMHVKIRTDSESNGTERLVEITVSG